MEILKKIVYAIFLGLIAISCNKTPLIEDDYLDGKILVDPSITNPELYLLSISKPNPTALEKSMPVVITTHGYSASTFEWKEFADWSKGKGILLSQVLLGGHGTSFEDFKNASWKDWQSNIIKEYEALVKSGYTNINFLSSSTSSTLIIDLLYNNYFTDKVVPKNIFMVDPLLISASKTLSLIKVAGPIIGFVSSGNKASEDPYWYHFRPQESLQELNNLALTAKHQLEANIILPKNCKLKVYKSIRDRVVLPISAVLIYKGIQLNNGGKIDTELIDSDFHVYTRLALREKITTKDNTNQLNTFLDIITRVKK